jgi:hypothetical protein
MSFEARPFTSSDKPSAPPITNAGLLPSRIQPESITDRPCVVTGLPRSSSASSAAPGGSASRSFFPSSSLSFPGFSSISYTRASGGIRFVYSRIPSSIHDGILWPIARTVMRMDLQRARGRERFVAAGRVEFTTSSNLPSDQSSSRP